MNESSETASMAWRRYLAALPEVDPPDALAARLREARVASAARRPWRLRVAALAAAISAVALLASQGQRQAPGPTPAAVVVPAIAVAAAADPGLRRIDDEITLAYARNADEAELAALWQTRAHLIEALDDPAPAWLARL